MGIRELITSGQPVLILSPHLDDAVFSAYALLSSECRVEVATVFTDAPQPPMQTGWDRLCGFTDSDRAVEVRRIENEQALEGLSVTRHHVGLLDGQYVNGQRSGSEARVIQDVVCRWLASQNCAAVVAAPAGAGRSARADGSTLFGAPRSARREAIRQAVGPLGRAALRTRARLMARRTPPFQHPDHVLVRDAAATAMHDSGHRLALYEDLPYQWGEAADSQVRTVARRWDLQSQELRLTVDRDAKARRIAAYGSQLRYLYSPLGPLNSPAGLPPQERYWLLAADNRPVGRGSGAHQ